MYPKVRSFFARHPVLRDALLWALPAIIFGAVLRLLFLSYSPYAYWGSDSRSYYSFANKLYTEHYLSLDEKRRYLYPVLMYFVTVLPGATLKWLAVLQHALGVATLLPLAYILRKTLNFWRLWIIPVTIAYAGMPVVLWYEHELLGENVFFATLMWAFAGWVAWISQTNVERARRFFWWFFVPFALFLLTKPSGRFIWPGICVGLLLVAAWKRLDRRHWIALGLMVLVTLTVGSRKQGAWLLYVSTFPLTQLDTPLHADYKAEIRDMVEPLRRDIDTYYLQDGGPFGFLESPSREAGDKRPLWSALDRDSQRKSRIYTDLALEAIKAEPLQFLYLGWQRIVASANPSEFKEVRFDSSYFADRFVHHYEEGAEALKQGKNTPMPLLFGLSRKQPLPPYEEFKQRLSPAPDGVGAHTVKSWVIGYENAADLVHLPEGGKTADRHLSKARVTFLGVWVLAGIVFSFLRPYRSTLGVWSLVALGYAAGVFLVSQANPRYFGPMWVVLIVLPAVPADVLATAVSRLLARK